MIQRSTIIDLLNRGRFPLADEKVLQAEMASAFTDAGVLFKREVTLAPGDIVDFLVIDMQEVRLSGIAIEVKIKGSRRNIFKQLQRYCAHPTVREIILATTVVMGLPETINGKPATVVNLGRGWL